MVFIGAGTSLERATVAILGAPFDGTVGIRRGCRFGPQRIRDVSIILEDYSVPLAAGYDTADVCDAGDITGCSDISSTLATIGGRTDNLLSLGIRPVWLGGEHLITLGAVQAAQRRFSDLAVVVFDAHADLRDEYLGGRLSHATVCRRIAELTGSGGLFQLGVRSGTADEMSCLSGLGVQSYPFAPSGLDAVVSAVEGRPVYLSIDIDVVDPAHAPGTGSPEPGGPTARDVLESLTMFKHIDVVGADLVEVSPIHDVSDITSLLAARIVRDLAVLLNSRGRIAV